MAQRAEDVGRETLASALRGFVDDLGVSQLDAWSAYSGWAKAHGERARSWGTFQSWLKGGDIKTADLNVLARATTDLLKAAGKEARIPEHPFLWESGSTDGTPAEVVGINSARHNRPMPPSLRPGTDLSAA